MKRVMIAVTILLTGVAWADSKEAEPGRKTALELAARRAAADVREAEPVLKIALKESLAARRAAADGPEEESLEYWKRSLELTEEADSMLGDELGSMRVLGLLPGRAFHAEEFAKAEEYAKRALKSVAALEESSGYTAFGDVTHHAHIVLGMLALRDDDVEAARRHLLEAGKTPGSPALGTFGPNMTLAKVLLERGERDVVLEYFGLCRAFWHSGVEDGRLDRWPLLVRNGGIPEFGANLLYHF